ncbi:hypothetical protein ACLKA6_016484 [Drosophila palustris]
MLAAFLSPPGYQDFARFLSHPSHATADNGAAAGTVAGEGDRGGAGTAAGAKIKDSDCALIVLPCLEGSGNNAARLQLLSGAHQSRRGGLQM